MRSAHCAQSGRIRVAFYTDAREVGGAEISLGNLVEALGPRVDAVVVGTDRAVVGRVAACRPGTESVVLPTIHGKWHIAAIAAHSRAFRRLRPEILHVNLNSTGASPWAILCGLSVPGVRVVAVEHLPHPIRRTSRRYLAKVASRFLAAHVAVGDLAAERTARFIGVPRGSIRTIRNGVPDLDLEPLARPRQGSIIGSLGRLDEQKAYDVLVRSLPQLPGVSAVVVGEGGERARLVELAERLGVSERFILPGWSNEARRHLTTFDIFVLPSRLEGLPLVLLEAMLAGLPIVASDVGSVSEAVVEGSTGILVPPDDADALAHAIDRLVRDTELRRLMGDRGRRRARELFTVDEMASRYEALYDEVLTRASRWR
jgi:glycosyltransferase involved in cell wall biosynthesis